MFICFWVLSIDFNDAIVFSVYPNPKTQEQSLSVSIDKDYGVDIKLTIYDVTGKYHASLTTYNILNGFHNYSNLQSNIQYIGGIKNLIPILELYCIINCKLRHK